MRGQWSNDQGKQQMSTPPAPSLLPSLPASPSPPPPPLPPSTPPSLPPPPLPLSVPPSWSPSSPPTLHFHSQACIPMLLRRGHDITVGCALQRKQVVRWREFNKKKNIIIIETSLVESFQIYTSKNKSQIEFHTNKCQNNWELGTSGLTSFLLTFVRGATTVSCTGIRILGFPML